MYMEERDIEKRDFMCIFLDFGVMIFLSAFVSREKANSCED